MLGLSFRLYSYLAGHYLLGFSVLVSCRFFWGAKMKVGGDSKRVKGGVAVARGVDIEWIFLSGLEFNCCSFTWLVFRVESAWVGRVELLRAGKKERHKGAL